MGDTTTGRVVRAAAPSLIMAIVVFMVLTQLKIAPTIVTATYIALIGMLALAGALAFGLGGREVAGDLVTNAYGSAQDNNHQVKQEMRLGRERARQRVDQAQTQTQRGGGSDTPGARPRI